jgi:hypothetical protein
MGWVSHRSGPDDMEKRNTSPFPAMFRTPAFQPVA